MENISKGDTFVISSGINHMHHGTLEAFISFNMKDAMEKYNNLDHEIVSKYGFVKWLIANLYVKDLAEDAKEFRFKSDYDDFISFYN